MTLTSQISSITMAACVVFACAPTPADAAVTAYFSAATSCKGPSSVAFKPGGPAISVTLCADASKEAICGHSVQLEAESADSSNRFEVVAHKMGPNYSDPTLENPAAAIAIGHPASPHDFGGTRDNPFPPSTHQVLVIFTLRPMASAKERAYTLRLGKNSLVSVGKNGSCLENSEAPISARLTLERD